MRWPAILIPVVCVLAGAGYFLARPRQVSGSARVEAPSPPPPQRYEFLRSEVDRAADDDDAATVRRLMEVATPSDAQKNALIGAAGRQYMRRKIALVEARKGLEAGRISQQAVDALQEEVDMTRKVVDLAETLGQRTPVILMARADLDLERRLFFGQHGVSGLADHFLGTSPFSAGDLTKMESAYLTRFGHPLPVSVRGSSAFHRAMGFDHSGRFDIAVSPDRVEGVWVKSYLTAKNVPFYAFRAAVRGKATGAHIHIGPASTRAH